MSRRITSDYHQIRAVKYIVRVKPREPRQTHWTWLMSDQRGVDSSPLCPQLHVPLRLLCGALLFACNAIMWTFFSKALRHCSSSARATVTSTASNFISSVSSPHTHTHRHTLLHHCILQQMSPVKAMNFLCVWRPSWGGWYLARATQLCGGWASPSLCVASWCFTHPRLRPPHRRTEKTSNFTRTDSVMATTIGGTWWNFCGTLNMKCCAHRRKALESYGSFFQVQLLRLTFLLLYKCKSVTQYFWHTSIQLVKVSLS